MARDKTIREGSAYKVSTYMEEQDTLFEPFTSLLYATPRLRTVIAKLKHLTSSSKMKRLLLKWLQRMLWKVFRKKRSLIKFGWTQFTE